MSSILPDDAIENTLLDRYIAGHCSATETRAVHQWLVGRPRMGEVVAALRDPVAEDSVTSTYVDADWDRLQHMLHAPVTPVFPAPSRISRSMKGGHVRRMPKPVKRYFGIGVASICLAGIAGYFVLRDTPVSSPVPSGVYAAKAGERVSITLDDGTRIILAPASRMVVAGRTVALDGQALFTVTQKAATPFTVTTKTTTTTVLGTTFMVRSYSTEDDARVVVAEGRVQVAHTGHVAQGTMVLSVGDAVRVTPGGIQSLPSVDLGAALGWAQGKLVFEQTPLPEVLADVGRMYGLDIRIGTPALRNRRISAVVTSTDAYAVLDEIALVLGVRYLRDGNVITFTTY